MIGITFNFGGTAFVAFNENAEGITTEGHRRGVKGWVTENQAVGLFHVGNNVGFVGTAAACETGEREGRAHQLQKLAAINRFIPLRSMTRKLAVNQLFKMGIGGQFFESPLILRAGFSAELLAQGGEVQMALPFRGRGIMVFMIALMTGAVSARAVQNVKFLFLSVIGHSFRQR